MNREVILEALKVDPTFFNMGLFAESNLPESEDFTHERPCGTFRCISGNFFFQRGYTVQQIDDLSLDELVQIPAKAMGITEEQAKRLFFLERWPSQFVRGWIQVIDEQGHHLTPGTKAYYDRTMQRVQHFFDTNGDE